MKTKVSVFAVLLAAWALVSAGPASAHGDEESVPAMDSFATAMSLLQVQPDMTEMIADKIGDGLESDDTEGVDLDIAKLAQAAFEAGDEAQALALLSRATGMTPTQALTSQTDDTDRPSVVPLTDQLGIQGSEGRPSLSATMIIAFGAVLMIALGTFLAWRTR
jgi:hypothetical protein